MEKETIRLIDRWVGSLVCFLLTLHRRISDRWFPRPSKPPEKILFLKLIEQGATVLAYGALRRAIDLVGSKNVYFLVFKENRPILDLMEVIPEENVLGLRNKNLFLFAYDLLRAIVRVRRLGIDSTVDMEFFARAPAVIAYLMNARNRVGLHRFGGEGPYRGDLMTHRINYNPYLHTAKAYYFLVEALTRNPDEVPALKIPSDIELPRPKFNPTESEKVRVKELLNRLCGKPITGPLVLLNPNASDLLPLRKWPTERFVDLAKRLLLTRNDITLILTGAPSEKESAEKVREDINSDRCLNVAGHTTLRDLLVLYTFAEVLVTNDSGPGHFATLTNVATVVMFGPETPSLFSGLGERVDIVWAGLACSPCVNVFNHRFSPCKDNVCMQSIQVDEIYSRVLKLLPAVRSPLPKSKESTTSIPLSV